VNEVIRHIMQVTAGGLLGVGVLVLAVVLSHESWRGGGWAWWLIAALLAAGAVLLATRTRLAKTLTQRIANTAVFRRLTDTDQEAPTSRPGRRSSVFRIR